MDILNKLQDIFRQVFEDESIVLTRETTADDIEVWDSLTHLQIIMQTEKAFKIKFTTSQMKNMPNIGAMIEAIEENLK